MPIPDNFHDKNICIIGLGYVGLTLAVAMAETGFRVLGVEIREDIVKKLNAGQAHFWEPRLEEKLKRVLASGRLSFSRATNRDFPASVYIITVGTPLGSDGRARLDMVQHAAREVAEYMMQGSLVILRSTVKLGTTRGAIEPILRATGRAFDLAVCPERTLEGRALQELHELPQIIGSDSSEAGWRCQQLFGQMTPTTVVLNSWEGAELVKLVDNTYRDVMFGFANEISRLCTQVGLSADSVIRAGKFGYPRTNVALPGPVGGPCLEKDPHILAESAAEYGLDLFITRAARKTNELQPSEVARVVQTLSQAIRGFSESPRISLLGLAFKGNPPTDDLRGTMAFPILAELRREFPSAKFIGFDPVATVDQIETAFGIAACASPEAAFENADIVLLLNNHAVLQRMALDVMSERMARPGLIYDLWNMHDIGTTMFPEGIIGVALGGEYLGRNLGR